jgi:hypothetical protein
MEFMLHSILTSRVVLHIRAWTEETPGRTELNTNHLPDDETRILNRLEPIKFSTPQRSSLD